MSIFPFVLLIVAGVLRLPRRNLIVRLKGVLRRTVGSDWGYFTQKMTLAQDVETSVTSNGALQDSFHPDDQIPQRYATPMFAPFSSGKFVHFFVCFCDEYVLISLCFMSYAYQLIINAINLGFSSHFTGMGSQPRGIACGKDDLVVVACIKEVVTF